MAEPLDIGEAGAVVAGEAVREQQEQDEKARSDQPALSQPDKLDRRRPEDTRSSHGRV